LEFNLQTRRHYDRGGLEKETGDLNSLTSQVKQQEQQQQQQPQEASGNREKPSIAKLFEQGSNN